MSARTAGTYAGVAGALTGIPIHQSWLMPKRGRMLAVGTPVRELWAHPYVAQRVLCEVEYQAALRRRFPLALLQAAGVVKP